MVAKIKLTIGEKTYKPGEKITSRLSVADEAFLRREGYIEYEKAPSKEDKKGPSREEAKSQE